MNHYIFTVKVDDNSKRSKIAVAKFYIEISKLLSIYDKEIESYYKYAVDKIPEDAPRHTQHKTIVEIRKTLINAMANNTDHEFLDNEYVASFSARILLKNEYSKVHCVKCNKDYDPTSVDLEGWTIGSGLASSGGKSMECPNGHFLNSMLAWDT